MGPLGWQETVFIFLLALLIFGPKKLPELGKNLAKGLSEFRRASNELKSTWDREMSNLERETESLKEVTQTYHNEITSYDQSSGDSYYDEYGYASGDSAADSSTVGASATQGAESTADGTSGAPENTIPASGTGGMAETEGTVETAESAGTPANGAGSGEAAGTEAAGTPAGDEKAIPA